jgi:hypothetical protein
VPSQQTKQLRLMNKFHEKKKSPNKNIFILNEFRMIFSNKRTEIKIEEYSETKLMDSIHHFLKTFSIEQDVDFKFDDLPPLQDISIDISHRFVLHIRKKVKGYKTQDNEVSFTDEEGKTYKIKCLFGQELSSIKYLEEK